MREVSKGRGTVAGGPPRIRVMVGLVILLALVVVVAGAILFRESTPQPLGIPGRWRLMFNSRFDGSRLPSAWRTGWFSAGVSPHVNSLEDDCYSPANVTFPGDGAMHLEVTAVSSSCRGTTEPATGALVTTNPGDGRGRGFEYTYGVLQARVFLPARGSELADWPAVWAVGQPGTDQGEDDVVEGLNGVACWHFHHNGSERGGCQPSLTPGWHTVASDWRPGIVTFFYDGHQVGQVTTGVTHQPMYLVLDNSSVAGAVSDSALRVQYVRVWRGMS